MMGSQLVHLYALVRSDTLSYKIPYSAEAEKFIFNLIAQMDWDLFSIHLHPRALKWLFQQEDILTPLSFLILNVCRSYSTNKDQICLQANSIKLLDIQMIAELIVSGDNFVVQLMLSLLVEGLEEDRKNDIVHLVNAMTDILNFFPRASNEFILHGIAETLRKVFYSVYFNQIETCCLLIFNVLYLADHAALCQDEDWHGIILKVLLISFFWMGSHMQFPSYPTQTTRCVPYTVIILAYPNMMKLAFASPKSFCSILYRFWRQQSKSFLIYVPWCIFKLFSLF